MRKYRVVAAVLLLAGFILVSPAQTWTVEQVTDNTEPDIDPFVTVVSSGLMIIYGHDDGDGEVFTANNFSGSWTSARITDNSREDSGIDIAAVYDEQNAHITLAWQDTPDMEISYCSGSPGSWNIERVTDDAEPDAWPSLAIDKDGHIHMAYHKATGGDVEVFYANNVTGSWVSEQVTDNGTDDGVPWIALDSEDNPNIVYTDIANLWYTRKTAGIWTTPENVAPGVIFGLSFPFLVIDGDDDCHVSYAKDDGTDFEIYYANNVTGSWQEAKVTSNDYIDGFPTLVIDPYKKAHIAYLAAEGMDTEMFYATNSSGVWSSGRVTDNSIHDIAMYGRYFAVCAGRIGHIFYYNDSDGDLEIYHAYSNTPLFAAVEETEPVVSQVSINVDFKTTVRYSVPDAGHVSLKVYDASGSLVKTLVDGSRQPGEYKVTWNGETDAGVHAAPGVYFYHIVAAGQNASVKGVLK